MMYHLSTAAAADQSQDLRHLPACHQYVAMVKVPAIAAL